MTKQKQAIIIDDEPVICNMVRDVLIKAGFSVEIYKDPIIFAEEMSDIEFDLIILDWHMPQMLGIDLLKSMRRIYSKDDLPIVMLTSEKGHGEVRAAIAAGANGYVVKPFRPLDLMKRVQSVMKDSEENKQIRKSDQPSPNEWYIDT